MWPDHRSHASLASSASIRSLTGLFVGFSPGFAVGFVPGTKDSVLARQSYSLHSLAAPTLKTD